MCFNKTIYSSPDLLPFVYVFIWLITYLPYDEKLASSLLDFCLRAWIPARYTNFEDEREAARTQDYRL